MQDSSPQEKAGSPSNWEDLLGRSHTDLPPAVKGRLAVESHAHVMHIIESISDAFVSIDLAWRYVYVNEQAARMLGKTRDQLEGRIVWEVFPQAVELSSHDQLQRAMATRVPAHFEAFDPLRGRWYEHHAYPSAEGLSIFWQDITDRKATEQEVQRLLSAVQHEHEKLSLVLNSITDEVWFADTDKRFTLANPAALRAFGLATVEGVEVEQFAASLEVLRPDGSPRPVEEAPPLRALAGEVVREEEEIVRIPATGELRHRQVSSAPVRNAAGTIIGAVSVVRDITQRTRTEDALRFLAQCAAAPGRDFFQELARYLAQSLGMDFVCIDTLHDSLLAAQTLAMYFDGKFEDNLSYTLKDTPCGEVVGKAVCCFPQGVRHRFPKDVILQNMMAESYVGATLWSSQGQPIGLIAVIGRKPLADTKLATSILQLVAVRAAGELERRQAGESLAVAKASAEAASKAKDHFLAVLSHELRNPLNPVLATASMLRDDSRFDADTREQLEVICRNAELEALLIDDLLDVTRIERGKIELDRRPIDLCTVIRRATEICMPDIQARKLEFGMDAGPAPYMVDADPARLQQVFWNLLKNAIKFTPPGGCVGIRCRRDGDGFVVAQVNDSGVGIEPDAMGRIFNAFEQAERSVTRQFGGLGLGLTISKAMVEMHGGTIHAHSAGKGMGATFTVRLPLLADQSAVPAPPTSAALPNVPTPTLRILLVEDHGDTARIMCRLLSAGGHQVQHAANVASALNLADAHPFDLLLSDLGLPDGSGLDLMRALRAKGILVPGIALSGFGQETDIQHSRQAGFAAHLTKPISLQKLEEAMARIVGDGLHIAGGGGR